MQNEPSLDIGLIIVVPLGTQGTPCVHYLGPASGMWPLPVAVDQKIYWCAAAGKKVEDCLYALRQRAVAWARREGVADIDVLLSPSRFSTLQLSSYRFAPVTYNDWLTESTL